jgi:hypothetical protein
VAENDIALVDVGVPGDVKASGELVVRSLRTLVKAAIHPTAGPGTKVVTVPGAATTLNVLVDSDAVSLIDALAEKVPHNVGARRGAQAAVLAAARNTITPEFLASLPASAKTVVAKVRQELRAAGQGIVVGGRQAGTIRIVGNTIEGCVQGIHVGVSRRGLPGRESANEVIVTGNVVHLLVPNAYDRDRFAVFVGNAASISVVDTTATLQRLAKTKVKATPVEGIRIHGELGRYVLVRQTSLRNFDVGVRVVPLGTPPPPPRLWLVAETMSFGSTTALDAPAVVERERNVP